MSAGSIFGGAALVGLVNIVLLTAMATIGVYIYNLSTDIVGGVEVTSPIWISRAGNRGLGRPPWVR